MPKKKTKKKRLGRRLMEWGPTRIPIELAMRWQAFWLTVFGHRWAYFWARVLARVGWALMPKLRGYALRNVDLCFPDKDERERTRIARESFKHNVYNFVDYLLIPRYFTPGERNPYFDGTPGDEFLNWYLEGRPTFNMTAHLGNFEICCFNIGREPDHEPLMLIAKPVNPPLLDRWMTRARKCLGNEVVHADEGAKVYLRAIKKNRQCGTLVDQNGGDFAPVETFFGVPCTWQTDWTRLVVRRNVQVCFHACVRDGDRFHFRYLEPVFKDYPSDTDSAGIIRDYRDWLERTVAAHPEQYMWVHRRFKARKKGWPDRYANLGSRVNSDERARLVEIPAPRTAKP